MKFIYVFNQEAKQKMLEKGFRLLKSDDRCNMYAFEDNGNMYFEDLGISFLRSDTLTF